MASQSDDRVSIDEMLHMVQRFMASNFPWLQPQEVCIRAAGQPNPICFPVPVMPVSATHEAGVLTERQEDILAAIQESGKDRLIGKEIAKLAGYDHDSSLRSDLAYLVKCGRLVGLNPGYAMPKKRDD